MLLQLRELSLSYGVEVLLDSAELSIAAGERVALVGRNGTGKSTLMKIVSGEIEPDHVKRETKPGLKISRLEQEVPAATTGSVYEVTAAGLGAAGEAVARFHDLAARLSAGEDVMDAFSKAQADVEAHDGWTLAQQVEATLSRLKLDPEADFTALSGGQKRRVLLARALVSEPDLLLLDEPTNHLDIAAIAQLEEILLNWNGALLFITHDRAFLRHLATRIIDLDRGRLTSWPGDYDKFLEGKDKALADEERANAEFDKKLAQEETWIRQGIKARRTRNEGRVRALKAMRAERAERRERTGSANIVTQDAARSGKNVIVADKIAYSWGDKPIVTNLTTTIQRGDKVGIIGPNGAGKTTLIRLLLGQLEPDAGTIKLGTNLEIAHFDQHRAALDDNISVLDNVAGGRSSVTINGQDRHIMSYMGDFLFSPKRARSPTHVLSGGERNRLLLAKLFTRPANLLVMDEPTNDLDVETLELLEERLTSYEGTLLLVSHDRDFIDNVVTSSLVMEGDGRVAEYVGGYSDYLRQRPAEPAAAAPVKKPAAAPKPKPKTESALSTAERKELRDLPKRIDRLEADLEKRQAVFGEPGFYDRNPADIKKATDAHAAVEAELEAALERWEALEAKQG
ncbi:ATP-binding cassette domain-containing protein [Salinisphaera hydrothermalis]|uniref:ATP-binding protein Uup n=1 Tax=Salinisphaera hydrothermalis (strain C41B8) TaxID=1304275 RepID=A0A084IGT4_SALHC|nr:ATP-binding cassette domain-containing protein [Salinisphaera hydrothermalis]KEZ75918.1 ATPase component of ABC transporters with duplicated ATPase domain [Salinisphaera hydrothermalis C41B8]